MSDVVNCFNKIISLDKKTAGGRNFSSEFEGYCQRLQSLNNMQCVGTKSPYLSSKYAMRWNN